MIPNVLSIAGSDPSGGAGIQADIKAISANGGYAMAVVTGLTAQNTRGVTNIQMVDPAMVTAQIAAISADIRIDAIKIGMLGDVDIIAAVAQALRDIAAPIVLDPVMVAKGGDRLLQPNAVAALRDVLLPMSTVITPNLPEAADLLGVSVADTLDQMAEQARALYNLGADAVLLKGGHMSGRQSPDILFSSEDASVLSARRITTKNTHGTGCSLSSALATHLAKGTNLYDAAQHAKDYVSGAIAAADSLIVGAGHGPLHHFWAMTMKCGKET